MKALTEFLLALFLLVCLFLKIDPFHWLMPTEFQMILLCVFSAAIALYSGAVFRERARDERDAYHLASASRLGYLVGVGSLSVLLVVDDLNHRLSPGVVIVLALMIIVKLVVFRILQTRN